MPPALSATQVMALWPGAWRLTRRIGDQARMDGRAVFTKTPQGLHYREQGDLTLENGARFDAFRSYRYALRDGAIQCFFADGPHEGRPFHTLDWAKDGSANGIHPCGADLYRLAYHFHSPEKFTLRCVVTGPRKDYVAHTIFTKDGP